MGKDKYFISCFERASKQNLKKKNRVKRYNELGGSGILKHESDVQILINQPFFNTSTGEQVSNEFIENFKTTYVRGVTAVNEFISYITTNIVREHTVRKYF